MNGWLTHPVLLVGAGSAVGGVLRYAVGRWMGATWFPWGTLAVNLVGSFLLGLVAVVVLEYLPERYHPMFLLWGTGFCGGLTTFSTFEWELFKLIRHGAYATAGCYVLASVGLGLVAVAGGVKVAILLPGITPTSR